MPARKGLRERLSFEGGLQTLTERTASPTNTLSALNNWEPTPEGGLKVRPGWTGGTDASAPSNFEAQGIFVTQGGAVYVPNSDSTTQMTLRTSNTTLTPWATGWTVTGLSASHYNFPASLDYGLGGIIVAHPSLATLYSGTATIAGSPQASAVAVHANRVFAFEAFAHKLYYSALGDRTTWDLTNDYISIGADDDGSGVALKPYQGGLLIGKTNSVWFLSGTGPDNFNLTKLDGGRCGTGDSIAVTPYGAVFRHYSGTWIWNGGPVQRLDDGVDLSYTQRTTMAYTKDKLYATVISPIGSKRIVTYDFRTQAWGEERVGSTNGATPHAITVEKDTGKLFGACGGGASTFGSGTSTKFAVYRTPDSTTRAVDGNISTTSYAATTQAFTLNGPVGPFTMKHLYVRLYQRGTATASIIWCTPVVDGVTKADFPMQATGVTGPARFRLDVAYTGYNVYFLFYEPGADSSSTLFDIEEVVLEYHEEEAR